MQNNLTELIEIIEAKVKIESIISNYLHLEKKGNNYVGLCPFHSDSNPSLIVSPTKKIFKCFSCGAGGGIIKFVQNYENLNFVDSLKKVSDLSGINWKTYINEKKVFIDPEEELLKRINLEASNFFKFNLDNTLNKEDENKVKKYINERNLTRKIITKFKIGYAENSDKLFNFLLKKGFKEEDIIKSKLVNVNNGRIYDFFKDRIIFPIFNINNEVIAFSGRVLEEGSQFAKYLNSQETKIFNKQKVLYNTNNAENKIKLKSRAIIVEGFMDVIAYDRVEYENVLATMGTNFSKFHLSYLKNLTDNFLLSFDMDIPGLKTTITVGEQLLKLGSNVFVINIENGKDFDEFIKKANEKEIKEKIEKPTEFIHFLIKKILNKNELKEKDIHYLLSIIKLEKDGIKREKYLNLIKQTTSFNFVKLIINENFDQIIKTNLQKIENHNTNTKTSKDNKFLKIDRLLYKIEEQEIIVLTLMLQEPKLLKDNKFFFTKKIARLYDKIYNIVKSSDNNWTLNNLENEFTDNELIVYKIIVDINNSLNKTKIDKLFAEINNREEKVNFLISEYNNMMLREKIHTTDNYEDLEWLISKVNK